MGSIGCYSAGIRARRSLSGKAPSIGDVFRCNLKNEEKLSGKAGWGKEGVNPDRSA